MANEDLFIIAERVLDNYPHPIFTFDYGKLISIRKLRNARKIYAPYDPEKEQPILLVDDTFLQSAKRGMLLTNINLYFRLKTNFSKWDITIQRIPLKEIYALRIQISSNGSILLINKNKVAYIPSFGSKGFMKNESDILNELFEQLLKEVHKDEKNED